MDRFLQVVAGVMLAVILGITLSKQGKDWTVLLTLAVCAMVMAVTAEFLQPVLDFVEELRLLGNVDAEILKTLLKAVGIGVLAELAGLICQDSGNAALGKGVQILAAVTVLWLSLPLMQALIELVQTVMGDA